MPAADPSDIRHMRHALALARRGLGLVAPNPAVGCVLVRDGRVVGRGWTQPGGRPHAEAEALAATPPALAEGATAYVTLEPCCHHGRTPPCADALIAAGVARVVVALKDPDPRVDGGGLARLRAAGVAVGCDLLLEEAAALNRGFILSQTENRPLVTVKSAQTLDGRIATAAGESKWITGPSARAHGHLLRARHDAIAVGRRTAATDDPRLDCRIAGLADVSPLRVVFDSTASLPLHLDLVSGAQERPTVLMCTDAAPPGRIAALADRGVEVVVTAASADGRIDPRGALRKLAERGVTRLLIEGGATLIAAFLAQDLVDELFAYRAPMVIGGDGLATIAPLGFERLADAPRFVAGPVVRVGEDLVESFVRQR